MKKLAIFATFVLALTASLALADSSPVISPQSIVVNPKPSFKVKVWVDKDTSGSGRPSYSIGEPIQISVNVSKSSYVYVFDLNANGEITQILPNHYRGGRDNHLQAGQTKTFPASDADFNFNIGGPTGLDKVIAIASKSKLDTSQLAQFKSSGKLAESNQGEDSFAKTLSIIITPKPQEDWVTDTALFYVVSGKQSPPPPRFGTLAINSNPSGAAAYVDSQFVGYTPVNFGTTTGQHTVRLELSGYTPYQTTVTVQGGQTAQVNTNLSPGQQSGMLILNTNVGGASVFIDGNYVGAVANGSGRFTMSGLNVGKHTLRVSAPGYNDINTSFTIHAGQTTQLSFTMPQAQTPSGHFWVARLNLRGYPGATLTKSELHRDEATQSQVNANKAAVKKTVLAFGSHLQDVSLLALDASSTIAKVYAPYVTDALLKQWEQDPSKAPGRNVSSPWPDHISITNMSTNGMIYSVGGKIVLMTSNEVEHGGNAGTKAIQMTLIKQGGKWLINTFAEGARQAPQTEATGAAS